MENAFLLPGTEETIIGFLYLSLKVLPAFLGRLKQIQHP